MLFLVLFVLFIYLIEIVINKITISFMNKMWRYNVDGEYMYTTSYLNIKRNNRFHMTMSFIPFLNIYAMSRMINNLLYVKSQLDEYKNTKK